MGKLITSPVEKFAGTVVLFDPVPYTAFIEWEKATRIEGEAQDSEKQFALYKGVRAMVEDWSIPNFDINNPPATPRVPVLNLLAWLVTEIGQVINGDMDPNA